MKKNLLAGMVLLCGVQVIAQENAIRKLEQSGTDTSKPKVSYLQEITIVGQGSKSDIQQLPEIVGTDINAGKKML